MGNHRRRESRTERLGKVVVGVLVLVALGVGTWMYNGQPDVLAWLTSRPVTTDQAQPLVAPDEPASADAPGTWSCIWDPTRDDDWHNDVECFDGSIRFRPNLLTDIPKVNEQQMRDAGQEYENYLNAGGTPDIP